MAYDRAVVPGAAYDTMVTNNHNPLITYLNMFQYF